MPIGHTDSVPSRADRPVPDRPVPDGPAPDRPVPDRPVPDRPASDRQNPTEPPARNPIPGPFHGAQLALGIGAPVVLIAVWALFCAPRARVWLPKTPLMVLRTALLLAGAAAVFATGWTAAATAAAIVILLDAAITVMDRDALINQPRPA